MAGFALSTEDVPGHVVVVIQVQAHLLHEIQNPDQWIRDLPG